MFRGLKEWLFGPTIDGQIVREYVAVHWRQPRGGRNVEIGSRESIHIMWFVKDTAIPHFNSVFERMGVHPVVFEFVGSGTTVYAQRNSDADLLTVFRTSEVPDKNELVGRLLDEEIEFNNQRDHRYRVDLLIRFTSGDGQEYL